MLKNKDLICISTIDWDFLKQRHQVFMEFISRNNCRVFYIENLSPAPKIGVTFLPKAIKRLGRIFFRNNEPNSNVPPGIIIITPLILPFKNKIAHFINKAVFIKLLYFQLKLKGLISPAVWTYLATPLALEFIKKIKPDFLVYDCVFDIKTHPDYPKDAAATERKLIELSDLVLTDNHSLFERCHAINPVTHLIAPGVDFKLFASASSGQIENSGLLNNIGSPRACFFGGIDQIRLDMELIVFTAKAMPRLQIILIGPVIKTDVSALKLKNIHFIGTLGHKELARCLKEMDVLIMPYKIIPFSKSIMPAKIFESLACAKPIVSTPLEELKLLPAGLIDFAYTKEEFVAKIEGSFTSDNQEKRFFRLKTAEDNSWTQRLKELQIILDNFTNNKRGDR
jgi:glycosyltransferase involved in cell wall biosynthesis